VAGPHKVSKIGKRFQEYEKDPKSLSVHTDYSSINIRMAEA
jgi:hypothetical protein